MEFGFSRTSGVVRPSEPIYLAVSELVVGGRDAEVEEPNAGVQLFGDVVLLAARPADRQRQVPLGRLGHVRRRLVRSRQTDVAQRPQPVSPHPVRPRRQLALQSSRSENRLGRDRFAETGFSFAVKRVSDFGIVVQIDQP